MKILTICMIRTEHDLPIKLLRIYLSSSRSCFTKSAIMQIRVILTFLVGIAISRAGVIVAASTLSADIEELFRLAFNKPLVKLVRHYLLNDAEFQAVVRTINSPDAYLVYMRLKAQPELLALKTWLRTQLIIAGDSDELSLEDSSEFFFLFDPAPQFWTNNVAGWQGFVNQFQIYYQQQLVLAHIKAKVQENLNFAEFWSRVVALKPMYERVLRFPETQRLLAKLRDNGVDIDQLDNFIRAQFNWNYQPLSIVTETPKKQ